MRYFFILGRNPNLSIAEIFSYLESEGIEVKVYYRESNGLVLETDEKIDPKKAISKLGGTVAIGKVLFSGSIAEILNGIEKNNIYLESEIKFVYSVLNFADDNAYYEVLDKIKEKFKGERLKARFKTVGGAMELQGGEMVSGNPSKIERLDVSYFLFGKKNYDFGVLEEVYDSRESEKRDMNKPVRREELSISPRLAKILINLSQVKEKETLLDPFCGVGVVLQEALLQGINAVGIDLDSNAAKDAKKNIDWLKSNYKIDSSCAIINEDSKRIKVGGKIDGIATEPSLGELLRQIPRMEEAKQIIRVFENLIISVLRNLTQFVKGEGKIAFTAPFIRVAGNKRISCNVERICKETGLQVYKIKGLGISFPIEEFRKDKIVGREFLVLAR